MEAMVDRIAPRGVKTLAVYGAADFPRLYVSSCLCLSVSIRVIMHNHNYLNQGLQWEYAFLVQRLQRGVHAS
jgi:hypothetical protein